MFTSTRQQRLNTILVEIVILLSHIYHGLCKQNNILFSNTLKHPVALKTLFQKNMCSSVVNQKSWLCVRDCDGAVCVCICNIKRNGRMLGEVLKRKKKCVW